MDTQAQNFWIESCNKETALRFQWRLRYSKFSNTSYHSKKPKTMSIGDEVSQRLTLLQKKQDQSKQETVAAAAGSMRAATAGSRTRPESTNAVDLTLTDMRPATTTTKNLLYTGISAHGEGRKAYLLRRKLLRPDEKYDFPLMTSTNYGWKVLDYAEMKKSPHARTGIIRDSFYRQSGVMFS